MTPLVTIAIPCYNAGRWIGAAVQSALDQTWLAKEVVVVDDGSTDDSLPILEKFGTAIQLIRGAHRGGNAARNQALAAARGEWVQFLDADDYLQPEKIALQLAETDGGAQADVIFSPVWIEESGAREATPIHAERDIYSQWLAWEIPQTGGALWRRSALEAIGGWQEGQPCCQEHELYLRALKAGLRFVFAPTPHAVYRIWSEETVCRKDPRLVVKIKTGLIDDLRAWLESRGRWTEEHRRVAGRACFEMARTVARHDLREGARYYRDRRDRQLVYLEGPAAPSSYRMAIHALGFSGAELLARALR
jgi:glycosyltransferase involved in cell wall biosynthesis